MEDRQIKTEHADFALVLDGVSKRFLTGGIGGSLWLPWRRTPKAVVAVDRVSLTVRRGSIFGIVGSNGSGKSTLVRMIATLLLPDSGTVSVFGRDVVRDERAVKRLISRVSVEASFFKKLSPVENLVFTGQTYGIGRRESVAKTIEILGRLGIDEEQARRPMEQMSRGMQQKVAVARALMTSPVLLLLDEPTTGLDPGSKRDVQRFIREVRDVHDATVLLMSHDMAETESLCDEVAVMSEGKLIVQGTVPELLEKAVNGRPARNLEEAFLRMTRHILEEDEKIDEP